MRISNGIQNRNRRMPNGTYGGVRGRKTKVGRKLLRFPPTRFFSMLQARRDEELDGIGNLMQLYKFNGRDVMALDNNVYFCTR